MVLIRTLADILSTAVVVQRIPVLPLKGTLSTNVGAVVTVALVT